MFRVTETPGRSWTAGANLQSPGDWPLALVYLVRVSMTYHLEGEGRGLAVSATWVWPVGPAPQPQAPWLEGGVAE